MLPLGMLLVFRVWISKLRVAGGIVSLRRVRVERREVERRGSDWMNGLVVRLLRVRQMVRWVVGGV